MVAAATVRWSCARCDVSVGRIDGGPADLPETWTQADGVSYCLICSRAMVGEAAMESAPDTSSREELMRVRRDAVIEFEIDRTPEAPNRVIAHACRTSLMTVATVRRTLDADSSTKPSPVPSGT
jgi:hypothetical protein